MKDMDTSSLYSCTYFQLQISNLTCSIMCEILYKLKLFLCTRSNAVVVYFPHGIRVHALSDNIFVQTSLVTVVALPELVKKRRCRAQASSLFIGHMIFFLDAPCESIFVKTSLVAVVAVTELVKRKSVRICQKSTGCGY